MLTGEELLGNIYIGIILNYIYEECGRLERLSKKMMKLLELDQETELDMQEIPVKQLFEAAEKSCETILQEKQIRLEYSEHGEEVCTG